MLPGGLVREGTRRRDFAFGPVDGRLELALAEGDRQGRSVPQQVTAVLTETLGHLGDRPPTAEAVRQLCVGDRQFLTRRVAALLGKDRVWLTVDCGGCRERLDILVVQTELPVKPAGPGFPFATVPTSLGPIRCQAPNGAHQEAIAGVDEPGEARRELIRRCIADGHSDNGGASDTRVAADVDALSREDLQDIENALDEISPQVAVTAEAVCPECGRKCLVGLDPYLVLRMGHSAIFAEVHALASAYHWSEKDILAMPRDRRQTYLRLVDRSRGIYS
jgi:hypothetical protein